MLRRIVWCGWIAFLCLGGVNVKAGEDVAREPFRVVCDNLFQEKKPALPAADAITQDWLQQMRREVEGESNEVRRLRHATQSLGAAQVALNLDIVRDHTSRYTHLIPRGIMTNQASSGRCWIFAGCNVQRDLLFAQKKVDSNFEFSETYLHFFNMLEKSNRYLAQTLQLPVDGKRKKLREELNPGSAMGDGLRIFNFLSRSMALCPKRRCQKQSARKTQNYCWRS